MRKTPIVFAYDNNWTIQAGVAINSLLSKANLDTFYEIFILYIDLLKENQNQIKRLLNIYKNCSIEFIDCSAHITKGFEIRGITSTAYLRLIIPRILPQYEKVIFSDVDIVIREDISHLIDHPMENMAIAGVKSPGGIQFAKDNGYDPKNYINSGILVINIPIIKDEQIEQALDYAINGNFYHQDQDIINKVFINQIDSKIPIKYIYSPNKVTMLARGEKHRLQVCFSDKDINDLGKDEGIVHYAGPKPWNELIPLGDYWWAAYRESIYFDPEVYVKFQAKYRTLPPLKEIINMLIRKLFNRVYY